ncbi:unnamed protein product [Ilex paraguariensis]|uniref:Uncharacterized protein n=1 Tax=Ilex paraguariensis TaxID=185542 RepID=A0ABC8UXH3_9AQUA
MREQKTAIQGNALKDVRRFRNGQRIDPQRNQVARPLIRGRPSAIVDQLVFAALVLRSRPSMVRTTGPLTTSWPSSRSYAVYRKLRRTISSMVRRLSNWGTASLSRLRRCCRNLGECLRERLSVNTVSRPHPPPLPAPAPPAPATAARICSQTQLLAAGQLLRCRRS